MSKKSIWAMTPGAWVRLSIFLSVVASFWLGVWLSFANVDSPEKAAATAGILQAIYERGNYIEAGIWGIFALTFGVRAARESGGDRLRSVGAALTFFFFGLSDIVEVWTGAWWRPWWLFLWKASCVTSMVSLLIAYLRRSTRI